MFSPFTTAGNPLTWTVADVGKWLVSINMGKYTKSFEDAPINGQCLHDMDDETLRDLGVTLSVHRTTMLRLIRELFAPQGSFVRSHSPSQSLSHRPISHRFNNCTNRYQPHFLCVTRTHVARHLSLLRTQTKPTIHTI
jgi:hypothetical protein